MEILKFPHPALLKPCKPVTVFGSELETLLQSMAITMRQQKGIGLAANQVNLDYNMFVMVNTVGKLLYLVNPKIIDKSKITSILREGCLSLPGEYLTTNSRPMWVQIEYQDINGNEQIDVFEGIDSVCATHEIEHLEGKAFIQSKGIPKSRRIELCTKWGLKFK